MNASIRKSLALDYLKEIALAKSVLALRYSQITSFENNVQRLSNCFGIYMKISNIPVGIGVWDVVDKLY